ncbi:arylamine N-acetyltransferase family protein [Streptomyces griseocarneus]|uniref:arylamine N-acetyltransferase family protein n=1 Tax=Streptomyces griseocarneus TaxID=51201 RepID=UPI001F625CC4|nr:arylamine N-acetyltransferase [Streptomyces griseocarneus]
MDSTGVDAYLRRIDTTRPAAPDARALRELQFRHLVAVPFENLSVHRGEEITLESAALVDKIVRDGRGGFCYELNGAFAHLLTALGYRVSLLAGRVAGPDGSFGIPYDHLALRVEAEGEAEPFLVDVGFGRNSHHPLVLTGRGEQSDPAGVFTIAETEGGELDVIKDGAVQYRLEQRPRLLRDFESGCWWHRTSPKSPFTQSLVCSRLTEDGGRISISGRTLLTTGADGRTERREMPEDEVVAAYRTHFGFALDRAPQVRQGWVAAPGR